MNYKYFCGCCGHEFDSELPLKNEKGWHNEVCCPECGAWDIYERTPAGAAQSVKDELQYQAEISEWEDDELC